MSRCCLSAIALLVVGLVPARPGDAQMPVAEWTERPDARAPAGVREDALPVPGRYEVAYHFGITSYDEILLGTDRIPPILVLVGPDGEPLWDMVPLSMTVQRHELEIRAGYLDWLGFNLRIPFQQASAELSTVQFAGTPSAFGLGDVEARAMYSLHDVWPYRAHLVGGISFPTGSISQQDRMPDGPGESRTLPYPLQPGDGTFAVLPGAVLVAENEAGTVGFKADARIPIGENRRGWSRGNQVRGQLWMAYRFTDWVSGSARMSFLKTGNVDQVDPEVDPWSSPLAHPMAQGGTRVDVPVGVNLLFPTGPLVGNRLSAELIVPVHQDLDGPQLGANFGLAFSWGMMF